MAQEILKPFDQPVTAEELSPEQAEPNLEAWDPQGVLATGAITKLTATGTAEGFYGLDNAVPSEIDPLVGHLSPRTVSEQETADYVSKFRLPPDARPPGFIWTPNLQSPVEDTSLRPKGPLVYPTTGPDVTMPNFGSSAVEKGPDNLSDASGPTVGRVLEALTAKTTPHARADVAESLHNAVGQ